jgi:VIT1/CCC1 family predicted Fe2+/Mn2+ transporter
VDELSNPFQAAAYSCISFAIGSAIPLLSTAFIDNSKLRLTVISIVCSFTFILFGSLGSYLGGAPMYKGAFRVLIGGWISMVITFGIGSLFGDIGKIKL